VQLTSPPLQHHAAAQARVFSTAHLEEADRMASRRMSLVTAAQQACPPRRIRRSA
jgi:hypothetical protein